MGMFPRFIKRAADVMAPSLSAVFRRLVRLKRFPACWRQANVTPIQKGPSSFSYLDAWSGFEVLRLLHGRVEDTTIVVNSLSPQMSELVEDAIAS